MTPVARIILKSGKDQSLQRFHPWVFSGAIKKIQGPAQEGDLVEVFSNKDEFLALGHYQIGSIAVRIVSWTPEVPDYTFWLRKIEKAWAHRLSIGLGQSPSTNVFRLINAEGDQMPGLIADFYNGTIVLQMHSIGMFRIREWIVEAFREILGSRLLAVYDKSAGTLPFKAEVPGTNQYLFGERHIHPVMENQLLFQVDWEIGQKTGFFIDQRENRELVEKLSHGRKVLNMFGYSGGFSFYAMRGGATLVHTVDSSKSAIDMALTNALLNFPDDGRHEAFAEDAFDFFRNKPNEYDLIILDPPAFAKHHDVLTHALQGYKRINARAMETIAPGGLLFTFSCSQVVSRDSFRKAVFSGAALANRQVKILYQLSQPPDHPVNIYHPEGEYLKGLVLLVD
jgi:23S rRNA (cytosine1962-C5)-methyltransferase